MYLISNRIMTSTKPQASWTLCFGDTYSAKARGARGARWAGKARLSVESIIAGRTRKTLQKGQANTVR